MARPTVVFILQPERYKQSTWVSPAAWRPIGAASSRPSRRQNRCHTGGCSSMISAVIRAAILIFVFSIAIAITE